MLTENLVAIATDFSGATDATIKACVEHIAQRYELPSEDVKFCLENSEDLIGMLYSPAGWVVLGDRTAFACGASCPADRLPTIH